MPKLSFAQEMYEMERVVGAARSNAGLLPDFSQDVADQLEALIAEAKAVKAQQQALLAAQMMKTEELAPLIRRGKWAARRLRAYVMLELGTRHAQLTQFGIRLRRRPRRADAKERPVARRSRAIVRADGAAVPEIGGIDLRLGGEGSEDRAVDFGLGATAVPERGTAAEDRATALVIGEMPNAEGQSSPTFGEPLATIWPGRSGRLEGWSQDRSPSGYTDGPSPLPSTSLELTPEAP